MAAPATAPPATAAPAPAAPTNLLAATPPLEPARLAWFNPPPLAVKTNGGQGLLVKTAHGTDFWQRTHYGFRPDNGHFYYCDITGDFVMTTTVNTNPNARFDQAGLMVRISPSCWLKTSVEYQPGGGPCQLGAVVTNSGYSDWSTVDIPAGIKEVNFRVRREGSDYLVEACLPAAAAGSYNAIASGCTPDSSHGWTQIRMAHLIEDTAVSGAAAGGAGPAVSAGLYCCSPLGQGFEAEFKNLMFFAGRIAARTEDA